MANGCHRPLVWSHLQGLTQAESELSFPIFICVHEQEGVQEGKS